MTQLECTGVDRLLRSIGGASALAGTPPVAGEGMLR